MKVFILGGKGTGKTVLAACMFEYIIYNLKGRRKNFENVCFKEEENEEHLNLEDVIITLREGKWPRATSFSEAYFYRLSLSKGWIFPETIDIEIIDYGGENFEEILDYLNSYLTVSGKVIEMLKGNELVEEINLIKKIESISLELFDIQDVFSKIAPLEIKSVILLYLVNKIIQADKLLFIVDGNKVKDWIEKADQSINKDFGIYVEIMQKFGIGKEYAIVITKADYLDNKYEKRRYKSVDNWINFAVDELKNAFVFHEIINDSTIECFGVCLETHEIKDEKKPFTNEGVLPMWGYHELMDWII